MSDEIVRLKKDQRRKSILNTALDLMVEKGLAAVTMRAIAKTEGISETLLYRFFRNKFAIVLALIETRSLDMVKSLEELLEAMKGMMPDPKKTLPTIWKMTKKRFEENRKLIFFIFNERKTIQEYFLEKANSEEDPGFYTLAKKFRKLVKHLNVVDSLTNYFRRCKEAGNLRKDLDERYCAIIFIRLIWPPLKGPALFISQLPSTGKYTKQSDNFPPQPIRIDPEKSKEFLDGIIETQLEIFLHGILPAVQSH